MTWNHPNYQLTSKEKVMIRTIVLQMVKQDNLLHGFGKVLKILANVNLTNDTF